ncbi:MAG: DNA/RNA non-specific endonuclease [Sphaerochaetaceae bacterium]|nr:DNA/RNA non-specific endonuclease [Sphaerochaetaceae bacterium]
MAKKKSSLKRTIKNLFILILLFLILSIISLFVAPSEEEWQEKQTISLQVESIDKLELPAPIEGEQIIQHDGYLLSYNEKYEQASYVAYKLTQNELYGPNERKDNFREDPLVKTGSASLNDYKGSGYDRGHLCPAADQKESENAMSESFYMSNMSPQAPDFNRRIWADLEGCVRTFADNNLEIYVTTGPVLTDGPYETIGENEVAVPNYYYKVILDYTNPEIKAIGFILPNKKAEKNLEEYATSVDEVEEITNIDFFVNLPDDIEEQLESKYDVRQWEFTEFLASQGNGSFDGSAVQTNVTTNQSPQGFSTIFKEGSMYILVQIKKETLSLLEEFVPKETLTSLGIT